MRSIEAHRLDIARAVFTQGQAPYAYLPAFAMSLFLSGNRRDVDEAIAAGHPAGHVLPSVAVHDETNRSLRIAFDFDGVLASDESERVYRSSESLEPYQEHELSHRFEALAKGPLQPLLLGLNKLQAVELDRRRTDPTYEPRLRIALVTARSAPAHERAVRSLRAWGVEVNDAFFLGGIEKARVLEVLRPHIFFDDQRTHFADFVAGVHIPYGVANEPASGGGS